MSTVVAAAPSDARSRRSPNSTSASRPSARIRSAVVVRLPGSGVVSERAMVEEFLVPIVTPGGPDGSLVTTSALSDSTAPDSQATR